MIQIVSQTTLYVRLYVKENIYPNIRIQKSSDD